MRFECSGFAFERLLVTLCVCVCGGGGEGEKMLIFTICLFSKDVFKKLTILVKVDN